MTIAQNSVHKTFDVDTKVKNALLRDFYKTLVEILQFKATPENSDKLEMEVNVFNQHLTITKICYIDFRLMLVLIKLRKKNHNFL